MADAALPLATATEHGAYLVEGVDRFAIGGNLEAEVAAAVARHHQRFGVAPKAVIWDDAVLDFHPRGLSFGLARVFVPTGDPYIAAALDSAARAAVRADLLQSGEARTSQMLGALSSSEDVAHTLALVRLIGWPDAAPLLRERVPGPPRFTASISIIIATRGAARATMACLFALRRQRVRATLDIVLIDHRSPAAERLAVEATCNALFGRNARVSVRHLAHDALADRDMLRTGEVLVTMGDGCILVDPDTLQTIADWALRPGVGAAGPRIIGSDAMEAEPSYLSDMVRLSDGAGFACAAVARATWERIGADPLDLAMDGDGAGVARRLAEAGYVNIHVGTHRARHAGGTDEAAAAGAGDPLYRHLPERDDPESAVRRGPRALPIEAGPSFEDRDARALCGYVSLYRRALQARLSEAMLPPPLAIAFDELEAAAATGHGEGDSAAYFQRIDPALRAVCAAFIACGSPEQVSESDRESFDRLPEAMRALTDRIARATTGILSGAAVADTPPAAQPRDDIAASPTTLPASTEPAGIASDEAAPAFDAGPAAPDPDPDRTFSSHSDASFSAASHRLLVFADNLGASSQIMFLEGLAQARAEGRAAVRVVTEEDFLNLRSMRGAARIGDWVRDTIAHLRPTAIVFSRFTSLDGYRAIQAATADLIDVPRLCHIDDDFFTLPAVIGVDRYREGRHPRRIHCLSLIAAEADLILAPTARLGERLAAMFGAAKIGLCAMSEGGVPGGTSPGTGNVTIGYFGSATHNRDLEMIAPALRAVKADRPEVRIEIVGSVAKLAAAAALGDLIVRRHGLEHDYPAFRDAMRGWGWRIGLAPLLAHPFNAAKTPIKWTEYAQAGIPVIASRTEPYLTLGRQGALLLASPDEWHGRIAGLLGNEPRRRALAAAADRLLGSFRGWRVTEDRLLGLLERAAARRRLAPRAA